MRKKALEICIITFVLLSAWLHAGLLATYNFTNDGFGGSGPISETISLGIGHAPTGNPQSYDAFLTCDGISEQDIGTTYFLTPEMDSDFAVLQGYLTNGTPDTIIFSINHYYGSAGKGIHDTRLNGETDLIGHDLMRISLTVNDLNLNSADYSWDVTWGFWDNTIPEPATGLLFCLGALFIQKKRLVR